MNEIKQPVVRSLARVMEWPNNPRRGVYRGMEELKESLQREGLQDAIHVWERMDGDWLLKGHRRTRAMKELGWVECLQVVHHFADEREAYAFMLEDHGHTVPLDAEEKIVAIETGVKLGLTTSDLAPLMGVTEERAQLWFDLGEKLPQGARSALAKGELSVNTAELLLMIEDPKKRREASLAILKDPETGESMSHGQARSFIQANYVLPERWHREWIELTAKLKRSKKKVVDGYQYVEWAERLDYVLGDSGQPQPEYELGESFYPRDAEGRTWEQVAVGLQVPVYVCAAPRHEDGYVTLVSAAMMRDALSVLSTKAKERAEEEMREAKELSDPEMPQVDGMDADVDDDATEDTGRIARATSEADDAEAVKLRLRRAWLRTWLGAVYETLVERPTDVMTKGPWVPLFPFLAKTAAAREMSALHAWRSCVNETEALEMMQADKTNRAHLRLPLMLLLCAEYDASGDESVIREVGRSLGLDGARLDQAAAKAGEV